MMHECPPHDFYDSVTQARVNALSPFGFTERQREFLVIDDAFLFAQSIDAKTYERQRDRFVRN